MSVNDALGMLSLFALVIWLAVVYRLRDYHEHIPFIIRDLMIFSLLTLLTGATLVRLLIERQQQDIANIVSLTSRSSVFVSGIVSFWMTRSQKQRD